eukprot:PhM_4_TR15144/c0_g1_i1/m.18907
MLLQSSLHVRRRAASSMCFGFGLLTTARRHYAIPPDYINFAKAIDSDDEWGKLDVKISSFENLWGRPQPPPKLKDRAPEPPVGFTVLHEEGTSLLEVVCEQPRAGVHVLCHCMLPAPRRGAGDYDGMRPLMWNAVVTRGGFSMDVMCSTVNGVLCIDGISFQDTPRDAFEHSPEKHQVRRCSYQGPLMHQGHLAALSMGVPQLDTTYRLHQGRLNFYDPHQGTHTRYTRYDHLPVHTLSPELYTSIMEYLMHDVGIDDHLALFLDDYVKYLKRTETERWRGRVLGAVDPVRYTRDGLDREMLKKQQQEQHADPAEEAK